MSPAAAGKFVAWARSDLGAHGIAVRRDGPSQGPRRREWHFRLIAIPVETGTDAA
ncbi:hypothetical protein [Micromonospora sp. NPDC005806]|uniref:hypothetical protein n=1 Tax=Micromonospora sp. NPDC005806 TaxID=3364234 RepID=UPI003699AF40